MDSDDFFLTSNIFYRKNKLYYLKEPNKIIKISNLNWEYYLEEYGWININLEFKEDTILTKFGILDCGGHGDCLFLCVLEALKENGFIDIDVNDIRLKVSNQVTNNNFEIILDNYKTEKYSEDFEGNWDPFKIKNVDELRKEIQKPGENFMGDHIIIQLLEKELNINIVIINTESYNLENNKFKVINTGTKIEKNRDTIFLSYCYNFHYQLIGYFNKNKMITKFKFNEIPNELIHR